MEVFSTQPSQKHYMKAHLPCTLFSIVIVIVKIGNSNVEQYHAATRMWEKYGCLYAGTTLGMILPGLGSTIGCACY